jgi:hypothetical protein
MNVYNKKIYSKTIYFWQCPKYELNEEQNDVVFLNENTAHAMYNFLSTHEIKVENNEAMFVKSSSSLLLNMVLK